MAVHSLEQIMSAIIDTFATSDVTITADTIKTRGLQGRAPSDLHIARVIFVEIACLTYNHKFEDVAKYLNVAVATVRDRLAWRDTPRHYRHARRLVVMSEQCMKILSAMPKTFVPKLDRIPTRSGYINKNAEIICKP